MNDEFQKIEEINNFWTVEVNLKVSSGGSSEGIWEPRNTKVFFSKKETRLQLFTIQSFNTISAGRGAERRFPDTIGEYEDITDLARHLKQNI